MKYRIGSRANPRTPRNRDTWSILEAALGPMGCATIDELVELCSRHDHPDGGKGFVRYCIRNGWLIESHRQPDTQNVLSKNITSKGIGLHDTGFYLAACTSRKLKQIDHNAKTKVNCEHTKIGITKQSFRVRKKYYLQIFGKDLIFKPIISMPPTNLTYAESSVRKALLDKYKTVGYSREWFDTANHQAIVELVIRTLEKLGL